MNIFGGSEKYSYTLLAASTRGASPKTQFLRIVPFVFLILLVTCITFTSLYSSRLRHVPAQSTWPSWIDDTIPAEFLKRNHKPLPVPGAEDSLLMLKTGAQVLWNRLPIHITRLSQIDAPNQVIYSDLEETIQGHHVIDILANVSQKLKKHEHFKTYHEQQKLHKEGVSLAAAKIEGGWTLDKYKWLPMFEHAYKNYPDMKWYIFYEADSFTFWNALNRWLNANFDSEEAWYMGSRNMYGGTYFGHGGSGVVVSHGAMKKTFGGPEGFNLDDYDDEAISNCCGDALLGVVMEKKGVKMWDERHARFQGEQTWGIRHRPQEWCEPIFTLHHLLPKEVSMLHEWEMGLIPKKPILYRDLYEKFVSAEITDLKSNWNNLADGLNIEFKALLEEFEGDAEVPKDSKGNPKVKDACRIKCEKLKECLTWRVTDKECGLATTLSLGQKEKGVTSGWMRERIERLRATKCKA
ncbi:hypothetical protein TWF192_008226 [Orbilia oligospora]|nr:hypothetical protein TWF191_007895 [Orbilia oligospora]KAF3261768.1 hypothetical protein TWF192_008226 [Orbilia oligospora]